MIRPATLQDAEEISGIYNHYIESSTITFEEEKVSTEEMGRRIVEVSASLPWLVFEDSGRVLGYAYASRWKGRSAYRHSVESTIYLSTSSQGQGIGKRLYGDLLQRLRENGIHCVIAGIALPNDSSVRLHECMGFEKVAHFKEVGWKFKTWIDVGYWQILFH